MTRAGRSFSSRRAKWEMRQDPSDNQCPEQRDGRARTHRKCVGIPSVMCYHSYNHMSQYVSEFALTLSSCIYYKTILTFFL